jgi:hypothetical protein
VRAWFIGQCVGALILWWLYTNGHLLLAGVYVGIWLADLIQTLIQLAKPSADSGARG